MCANIHITVSFIPQFKCTSVSQMKEYGSPVVPRACSCWSSVFCVACIFYKENSPQPAFILLHMQNEEQQSVKNKQQSKSNARHCIPFTETPSSGKHAFFPLVEGERMVETEEMVEGEGMTGQK